MRLLLKYRPLPTSNKSLANTNETAANMANIISFLIWQVTVYGYGLFSFFLYLGLAVRSGTFFSKPTEQEQNEFLLGEAKPLCHSQTERQLTDSSSR